MEDSTILKIAVPATIAVFIFAIYVIIEQVI